MKKYWWIIFVVIVALVVVTTLAQVGRIRVGQGLRALAVSTDIDGDDIQYEFKWARDGVELPEYKTLTVFVASGTEMTSEIPAKITKKGEFWEVWVRVFDGEEWGTTTATGVAISGWPPSAPTVRIEGW